MALAAYRATRVIVADTILDSWRTRWYLRFPPDPSPGRRAHPLGQLVSCPWCIGFWISGATFLIVWSFNSLPLPGLWWPAIASAVGLMGKADD